MRFRLLAQCLFAAWLAAGLTAPGGALAQTSLVTAWGANNNGQTNVPATLTNAAALAVGAGGEYGVAVRGDGTVATWGHPIYFNPPQDLSNVVAIAGGFSHLLALKQDGTVLAWGNNASGQLNVPAWLGQVVAIAAGGFHSLVLKEDGSVLGWGGAPELQARLKPPSGLRDVVAIAAGLDHNLALKSDGTVVAWGESFFGQTSLPANLSNVVAIASGPNANYSLAVKRDGNVVSWGQSHEVPAGLTNVVDVATWGNGNSMALTAEGRVVAWGPNGYGQTNVPPSLTNVIAMAAGLNWAGALAGHEASPGLLAQPANRTVPSGTTTRLRVVATGAPPLRYQWLRHGLPIAAATNASLLLTNVQAAQQGAYSVVVSNGFGCVTSSTAALTVTDQAPSILVQPTNQVVGGTGSAVFELRTDGSKPLFYQWSFQGTNLPGATHSTLDLTVLSPGQGGGYSVLVSNAFGSVRSSNAMLTVLPLAAWGYNADGQAGLPTSLASLTNLVAVAAGYAHNLALKADGTLFAWGSSRYGQTNVPAGLSNVVQIAAAKYYNLVLRADGTVSGWGQVDCSGVIPVAVSNAVAISAAADHSLVLLANGGVIAFGCGKVVPPEVTNVIAIAAGDINYALGAKGTLFAWSGYDSALSYPPPATNVAGLVSGPGQMLALQADGTVAAQTTYQWRFDHGPTEVPAGLSNVVAVAVGSSHSLVLKADGTVLAWGDSSYGATAVPSRLTNVVAIAAGDRHSLALVGQTPRVLESQPATRTLYSGQPTLLKANVVGAFPLGCQWQLGGTNIPGATTPTLFLTNLHRAEAGLYSLLVSNASGTARTSNWAVAVVESAPFIVTQPAPRTSAQARPVTWSVAADGSWPLSYQWRLGDQPLAGERNPTLVLSNVSWADAGLYSVVISNEHGNVASSNAALTVLPLAAWDYEGNPLEVPLDLTNVVALSAGSYHSLALREDGTVAAWGGYAHGTTDVPPQLRHVVAIAAGEEHSMALIKDGTVVAWGESHSAQNNIPAGLSNVVAIADGAGHCLALKQDGTVVAWGDNGSGQTTVPVGLTGVVAVATGLRHSVALKRDGTVVAWGANGNGQTSVPFGLTNVLAVAANSGFTLALKEDGSVVVWGWAGSGQTRLPEGLTNVVALSAGGGHCLALREDGTVVNWGATTYVPPSLPVTSQVSAGNSDSLVLTAVGPPKINRQPENRRVYSGQAASFLVQATGPRPIHYQWRCQGTNLPGATQASLRLTNLQVWAAGDYSVWVSNAFGAVLSSNALLAVEQSPPQVVASPLDQSAYVLGENMTFTVGLDGSFPLACQWQFNGANLPGATGPELSLTNVQVANLGEYRLVVSNAFGAVTSAPASLTAVFSMAESGVMSWTPAQGPLRVTRTLTVPANTTLAIAAGTVVKFASAVGLNVAGTLEVLGTPDQPVILTSWRDDGAGGDSDGTPTAPAAGDWSGLSLTTPSALAHLRGTWLRYADNGVQLAAGSARLRFAQSVLSQNRVAVGSSAASTGIEGAASLLFSNLSAFDLATDSALSLRHCTVSGNTAAGYLGRSQIALESCIVAFNDYGFDGAPLSSQIQSWNCLYYSPEGPVSVWMGDSRYAQGRNRSLDPMFVSAATGRFELATSSPGLDAGRGFGSDVLDLLGRPPHDDRGVANTGAGEPAYADIGALERQEDSAAVDLAVAFVSSPTPAFANAGDSLTLSWMVKSLGQLPTGGTNWVDVVYLSADPYLSDDDLELGRWTNSFNLLPDTNYTHTLTVPAPPGLSGIYYPLVRANATRSLVEPVENNNVASAAQPLALGVPAMVVGAPLSGTLASGTWTYLRIEVTSARSLTLDFAVAAADSLKVYARYGAPPTSADYDALAAVAGRSNQTLRLPSPLPGTYFIGLYVESLPGGTAAFSGSVALGRLALSTVTPTLVGNSGRATLKIEGMSFTPDAQFRLKAAGRSTLEATEYFADGGTVYATFDLAGAGAPAGLYDLEVTNQVPEQFSLAQAVVVTNLGGPDLQVSLLLPGTVRPVRVVTARLRYENRGNADLASPLLTLLGPADCEWQLPGSQEWRPGPLLSVIALSTSGPANILRPGQVEERVVMLKTPPREGAMSFQVGIRTALADDASGGPINWTNWYNDPAMVMTMSSTFGNTWSAYIQALGQVAANLALLGRYEYSATALERAALRTPALTQDLSATLTSTPTARTLASVSTAPAGSARAAKEAARLEGAHIYAWSAGEWKTTPLQASDLTPDAATVLIIHGWNNSIAEDWIWELGLAVATARPEVKNILTVEWGGWANTWFLPQAAAHALPVAYAVRAELSAAGVRPEKLHLIGHSLGAHVAGLTGNLLGGKVARITALDPADELSFLGGQNTLGQNWGVESARFIDVYKSSALAGGEATWGHDNFLLVRPGETWGSRGILSLLEAHSYSHEWFTQTISSGDQTPFHLGYEWNPARWADVQNAFGGRWRGSTGPWKGLIRGNDGGSSMLECASEGLRPRYTDAWHYPGAWGDYASVEADLARAVEFQPTALKVVAAKDGAATLKAGGKGLLTYTVLNWADNRGISKELRRQAQTGIASLLGADTEAPRFDPIEDQVYLYTNGILDVNRAIRLTGIRHDRVFIDAGGQADFAGRFTVPGSKALRSKWNLQSLDQTSYFVCVVTGGAADDLYPGNDTNAVPVTIAGEEISADAGGNHIYRRDRQGEWVSYTEQVSGGRWIKWYTEPRYPEATFDLLFDGSGSMSPELIEAYQWSDGGGMNPALPLTKTVSQEREAVVRTLTVKNSFTRESDADTATLTLLSLKLPPIGPRPADVFISNSRDPEDKFGPTGFDLPGTAPEDRRRFITGDSALAYRIEVWNKPDAALPAQSSQLYEVLDTNVFDVSTFEFTRVGFLKWDLPLAGGQALDQMVAAQPELNLRVRIRGQLDPLTARVDWRFDSLDPMTGLPPEDPFLGFLPALNTNTFYEMAWVEYRVKLKPNLPSGTVIANQAFGRFEDFGPYGAAPLLGPWINTLDVSTPTSHVLPLPATTPQPSFVVSWSGQDETNGSGVAAFNVSVRDNDGPWTLWLANTTNSSATFAGQMDHTYAFYSVARDQVGHLQAAPAVADTATRLSAGAELRHNLLATYNLVTVPFSGTGLTNAAALARAIPNCSGLWKWDATAQGWAGHRPGGPNNFEVSAGQSFMAAVTAGGQFTVSGPWTTASQSLRAGYNLVVLTPPHAAVTNAETLVQSVAHCTGLWKWDATVQGWSGHRSGGPNNFGVEPGRAYLIYLTAPAIW